MLVTTDFSLKACISARGVIRLEASVLAASARVKRHRCHGRQPIAAFLLLALLRNSPSAGWTVRRTAETGSGVQGPAGRRDISQFTSVSDIVAGSVPKAKRSCVPSRPGIVLRDGR
jgi:hypothetical protein